MAYATFSLFLRPCERVSDATHEEMLVAYAERVDIQCLLDSCHHLLREAIPVGGNISLVSEPHVTLLEKVAVPKHLEKEFTAQMTSISKKLWACVSKPELVSSESKLTVNFQSKAVSLASPTGDLYAAVLVDEAKSAWVLKLTKLAEDIVKSFGLSLAIPDRILHMSIYVSKDGLRNPETFSKQEKCWTWISPDSFPATTSRFELVLIRGGKQHILNLG